MPGRGRCRPRQRAGQSPINTRHALQTPQARPTKPHTCRPMNAKNRPMPAEVASMMERGMSSISLERTPSRARAMKMKPSTNTAARAVCVEGGSMGRGGLEQARRQARKRRVWSDRRPGG